MRARRRSPAQASTTSPRISLRRRLRVGVETSLSGFMGNAGLISGSRPAARLCAPGTIKEREPGLPELVRLSQSRRGKREESKGGTQDANPWRGMASISVLLAVRRDSRSLGGGQRPGQKAVTDRQWLAGGTGFSRFLPLATGAGESRTAGGPRPAEGRHRSTTRYFTGDSDGNR